MVFPVVVRKTVIEAGSIRRLVLWNWYASLVENTKSPDFTEIKQSVYKRKSTLNIRLEGLVAEAQNAHY